MNSMQITRQSRSMRTLGTIIAIAGLWLVFGTCHGHAQNAAQLKALSRLSGVRPQMASQDGQEAANISLNLPSGVAFDTAGNLYIADTGNNTVLKVDLTGIVSTVAGEGTQGFAGDGGTASSALLDTPLGVAVDTAGNVYIADTHNHRIRMVSGGVITTIAGTGVAGFSGDGAAATAAMLDLPNAVAVDTNGNIYIADTDNHRIREISGGIITTVAGDGTQDYAGDGGLATAASLDSPSGIAVDASFNLYIGDTHNQRVRMITAATGVITTLAGTGTKGFSADGAATSADLANPRGVAVDSTGTVYVADSDNQRIRSISNGQIATIAGNGTQGFNVIAGSATSVPLNAPRAVAVSGSAVVFTNTLNNQVSEESGGEFNTVSGNTPAASESLTMSGPITTIHGSGALTATFANGSNTATGFITFYDGLGSSPVILGTLPLSSNTATINTSTLDAGTHHIVAAYVGDANNAAITSGVYVLTVTPSPLTVVANNASVVYGSAMPAFTGTLTGVINNDGITATYSTTAVVGSSAGTYTIAPSLNDPNSKLGNYSVTKTPGTLTITQAQNTSAALTASSSSAYFGTSVTFTATVSNAAGVPTGNVSFYDGTTLIGSSALNASGVAVLSTSSLSAASHSITAVYTATTNFSGATSNAVALTVNPSTITINGSAGASSLGSIPLIHGGTSTTAVAIGAMGTLSGTVTFGCEGLPAGLKCAVTPASIDASKLPTTVTLTFTTTSVYSASNATHSRNTRARGYLAPLTWTLAMLLPGLFFAGRNRKRRVVLLTLALAVLLTLGLSGCGSNTNSGGSGSALATGSYNGTFTVTPTGASATTATFTVTLK